jgi:2-isopropylmalate synthase
MQIEFARVVQQVADADGGEIAPERIWALYRDTYLEGVSPLRLLTYSVTSAGSEQLTAEVEWEGARQTISGEGNGPIAAFVHALASLAVDARVLDYHEHATSTGEEAQAAAYVEVAVEGQVLWGCGVHPSITTASLHAIASSINRGRR